MDGEAYWRDRALKAEAHASELRIAARRETEELREQARADHRVMNGLRAELKASRLANLAARRETDTLREAVTSLADKWEAKAGRSLRDFGVPTHLAPLQAVRELREAIASAAVPVDTEPECGVCKGRGVLDDNGNPSVWGRVDSYECPFCAEDDEPVDTEPGTIEATYGLSDEQQEALRNLGMADHPDPAGGLSVDALAELRAAWKYAEALRYDDPFARRGMLRLARALIAFHDPAGGLSVEPDVATIRAALEDVVEGNPSPRAARKAINALDALAGGLSVEKKLRDALAKIERMAGAAGCGETPAQPLAEVARSALASVGVRPETDQGDVGPGNVTAWSGRGEITLIPPDEPV